MPFYTFFTNYDHMSLVAVKKPKIPKGKLRRLAASRSLKIAQKEKKSRNEGLVYRDFKTRKQILILTINSRNCLRK